MKHAKPLPCALITLLALFSPHALAQDKPAPPAAAQPAPAEPGSLPSLQKLQQQLGETADPAEQQRIRNLIKTRNQVNDAEQAAKPMPTPPDNPTREDWRQYIIAMREFSTRQDFNQFKVFGDIPAEYLDVILLEAYDESSPFKGYWSYKSYTYKDVQPAKANIISRLKEQPRIIQAITYYGWAEDVREQIVATVNRDSPNVSFDWFEAAVELNEPNLYPKLYDIAVNAKDARGMIALLETLPDYDFTNTVLAYWEKTRKDKYQFRMSDFASIAARAGSTSALEYMLKDLSENRLYPRANQTQSINQDRLDVLKLIDFRGTTPQILKWYETNKDNIAFDSATERFIAVEDF